MRKRPTESFLIDILVVLCKLRRYVGTFETFEEFYRDEHDLLDGALHNLEQIGEALKYVLADEKFAKLVKKSWRVVIGFRNILVHEYFHVDRVEVYEVLTHELPIFELEFFEFVDAIKYADLFQVALADGIQEQQELQKDHLVRCLQQFVV